MSGNVRDFSFCGFADINYATDTKTFFIWWVKRAEREADHLLVVRGLHYAKIWRHAPIHVHLRVLWRRNNYCYAATLYFSGSFENIPET